MKAIIFDASTMITLTMNGLLKEFRGLKKIFNGKFLITKDVKKEIVDKPSRINRFKLEALKLNELISDKVLEMSSSVGINPVIVSQKTEEFKKIANSTFTAEKEIHILDSGEASCFALSRLLDEKNIQNVLAIDERTARMLGEKPENLHKLLERKLHKKITAKKENYEFFKGFKFIRSSELIYVAYKKGIIGLKNGVLEALLYAVKFKGCAISNEEINEIRTIGKGNRKY
ncbi:hypothetical protein DRN69_02115 [Candidatus Pacearchaeota archaeon]|nr:MAG: hypothetical protein DRN69_02115 [Candidatus Pacearchaeota archaeon]